MPFARLASVTELKASGIPPGAVAGVSDVTLGALLDDASAIAYSHLRKRYTPPFTAWGADVRRAVVALARGYLFERRGASGTAADEWVIRASADATTWLQAVALGEAEADITDSTGDDEAAPLLSSEASLSWGSVSTGNAREEL